MDLSAYSVAQLQIALGLMRQGITAGFTAETLAETIAGYLSSDENPPAGLDISCPTPGCPGHLVAWPQSSRLAGVPVLGCRLCMYSRMEVSDAR